MLWVVAAQNEFRQVHNQGRIDILVGQPAPALQRILKLDHTLRKRDIEALDGVRREFPVIQQTMAMLVEFDRSCEIRGVDRRKIRRRELRATDLWRDLARIA